MKTILIACVAAIVIAVIGGVVLTNANVPADKGFSESASVRLGPGQQG
jgi:hypothetical protein